MNGIERISAAFDGRFADRPGVSLISSLYGARLTSCDLADYYTNPVAYARGQSAVLERFRPDVLFGPFALPLEGAAFGSQIRIHENQAPNLARPVISSADEISRLEIPDVDSNPQLLYFREAIRQMSAEHGAEVPIVGILLGPTDLPAMIMGAEGWLETLLFDEKGAKRMLEIAGRFFVRWANTLLGDGATFVACPANFANPTIVTREIISKLMIPVMRKTFSQVGGPIVIHSGGAQLIPALDMFADLPNVVGFVLNGGEDFNQAREIVGPQPVLLGNIEGPSLFLRKREEIEADCFETLRNRRHDPRFVLSTSMADIGFDTPSENIDAFRQTVEAFAGEGVK